MSFGKMVVRRMKKVLAWIVAITLLCLIAYGTLAVVGAV